MAEIKKVNKGGTAYLWANNLIISDVPIGSKEFTIRYKSPKGSVSEKVVVPNSPDKKEDYEAFHKLWWALKDIMHKASPKESINPFKIINSPSYRGMIRFKGDPEQLSLDLPKMSAAVFDNMSNELEALGRIKDAYLYDMLANTIETPGWIGNESNLFWEEMGNEEIEVNKVKNILDLVKKGITDIEELAEKSDLKKEDIEHILGTAKKFELIKL